MRLSGQCANPLIKLQKSICFVTLFFLKGTPSRRKGLLLILILLGDLAMRFTKYYPELSTE